MVTGKHIPSTDFQLNLFNELILKYKYESINVTTNRTKEPMDILENYFKLNTFLSL